MVFQRRDTIRIKYFLILKQIVFDREYQFIELLFKKLLMARLSGSGHH